MLKIQSLTGHTSPLSVSFRNALNQHALFIGRMFGEGNEPTGEMSVILDKQISESVIGTYAWSTPVTVFNPWFPEKHKKVEGVVATLIAMVYIIQNMTGGIYDETNSWMLDAVDNAKEMVLKMDNKAYMLLLD